VIGTVSHLALIGLLDWDTVAFGFERGWITQAEVGDFATRAVVDGADVPEPEVAQLAGALWLDSRDVGELLSRVANPASDPGKMTRRWALATLLVFRDSGLDEKTLQQALEDCYAEFGYLPEMRSLSRYSFSDDERAQRIEIGDAFAAPISNLSSVIAALGIAAAHPSLDS
jgi:hypothetical protein